MQIMHNQEEVVHYLRSKQRGTVRKYDTGALEENQKKEETTSDHEIALQDGMFHIAGFIYF